MFSFANAIYILDVNRVDEGEELFESVFDNKFVSALINQYLLALGEFGTDNFSAGSNSWIIWLLFIGATFLSQITILNMLIAIMGDTFDSVSENKG